GNAQATVKFERDSEHGALSIDVQGAQLRDGERELAALQALTARVPTASAELFHLQSLQVLGLRAEVGSSTAGLELLGVRLAAAPAPDAEQPTAAATQDRAAAVDLAARTASSLPALRIDELKVEVARVLVRDPSHPDATPCEIAALLTLVESWQTAADKSAS